MIRKKILYVAVELRTTAKWSPKLRITIQQVISTERKVLKIKFNVLMLPKLV